MSAVTDKSLYNIAGSWGCVSTRTRSVQP